LNERLLIMRHERNDAERHVNWFALEKACEQHHCPVCTIVSDRATRFIDNMLFEHVSDRGFRATYRASGGFCSSHARNLESWRDGLAVAILGEDILSVVAPELRHNRLPRFKGVCPACTERDRIENEFLGYIAEQSEQVFIDFFCSSGGLCIPHFIRLLRDVKKVPSWLKEFHNQRFQQLQERTRQFIECSAWGRQDDFEALSSEDKVVWKELARTLHGSIN